MKYVGGERVITTHETKFHKAGTHGIVNNDRDDFLGATGPAHGKAMLMEKAAVRIATPADPGYYGTREEFSDEKDAEISELKVKVHNARVYVAITTLVAVVNTVLLCLVATHV